MNRFDFFMKASLLSIINLSFLVTFILGIKRFTGYVIHSDAQTEPLWLILSLFFVGVLGTILYLDKFGKSS